MPLFSPASCAAAAPCAPPSQLCGVSHPSVGSPWFSSSWASLSSSWNSLRRLAGIHQVRIVHSAFLATPCRSLGRSYNPPYVFEFPKRIDRMTAPAPIAIIMGSQSDWDTMRHAAATLTALGVTSDKRIISAHHTPDLLLSFAQAAKPPRLKVINACSV